MSSDAKRLALVAAAFVGGLVLLVAAFVIALEVRSVVAGPNADPGGPVPNPGHAWTEMQDHGVDGVTGDYWLGTTDLHALEMRVNNARALRLEPNGISPNVIGGYSGNSVTDGAVAATIAGGGRADPGPNRVSDDAGSVGGGVNNQAGDSDGTPTNARGATVGGGNSNTASAQQATIGGGWSNTASAPYSTIAGGGRSDPANPATANRATDDYSSVGGGGYNLAGDAAGSTTDTPYCTVAGGYHNTASGDYATVGGGASNTASGDNTTVGGGSTNHASGYLATIGGGEGNAADGNRATVGGGDDNTASGVRATVGGGWSNIASGAFGATVGGGQGNAASGNDATVGGGNSNTASGPFKATVSGGGSNTASGGSSTVGGGQENEASGVMATVGGGQSNMASGESATVGGGNSNSANGDHAAVCGGVDNIAGAPDTTIGGGSGNTASSNWDTVGGGEGNTASGWNSTVGGGYHNTASGLNATVPGGAENTAGGAWSFAAGRRAKANNQGCFVWGDITDADVACNDDNRFIARASGGVYLYTSGDLSTGAYLASGSGSWTDLSDRNLKDNFTPVDGQDVLARLAQIPIATWNYKAQDDSIRHMGPAAQDFSAAFGLGESETGISTVDADGVALAAIQGLHQIVQELQAENANLKAQLGYLESRVTALDGGGGTSGAGAASGPLSGLTAGWLALGGLAVVAGLMLVQRRRTGSRP